MTKQFAITMADADLDSIIGAGTKSSDAYFVKVDSETTTQADTAPKRTTTVRAVQIMK